jgi:hypothetical protein
MRQAAVALSIVVTLAAGCGSSKKPASGDGAAGAAGADGGAGAGGNAAGSSGQAGLDGGDAAAADRDATASSDAPLDLPPLKVDGPWLVRDVGELGDAGTARGSLDASSELFTVRGTGVGVNGGAKDDGFFFAYQHLAGDGEIVARVKSLLKVSPTAQVGIMVRADDIDSGAANVFLSVDGDGQGGHLRSRASAGAAEEAVADANVKEGRLLRLARTGKVVAAYCDDGAGGWTQVGVVEVPLPAEVVVGLAATDGAAGSVASAAFDVARVGSIDADAATKGWVLGEVGTTGGSALVAGGVLTLSGLGERTAATSDVGVFFQRSANGIQTITARVAELRGADARVGVIVREGAPDAPAASPAYAYMSVSTAQGAQFGNRSKANGNAQAGAGMSGVKAPVWLRLEKLDAIDGSASTFTGFVSSDGETWNVLDSLTFPFQQPYSIGVFLLAGSPTGFAAARLTDLAVTAPK